MLQQKASVIYLVTCRGEKELLSNVLLLDIIIGKIIEAFPTNLKCRFFKLRIRVRKISPVTFYKITVVFFNCLNHFLKHLCLNKVIGIHTTNIGCSGIGKRYITNCSKPSVLFKTNNHYIIRILLFIFQNFWQGIICWSIIYKNQLHIINSNCLILKTVKASVNKWFHIIAWNNHADLFLHLASLLYMYFSNHIYTLRPTTIIETFSSIVL